MYMWLGAKRMARKIGWMYGITECCRCDASFVFVPTKNKKNSQAPVSNYYNDHIGYPDIARENI